MATRKEYIAAFTVTPLRTQCMQLLIAGMIGLHGHGKVREISSINGVFKEVCHIYQSEAFGNWVLHLRAYQSRPLEDNQRREEWGLPRYTNQVQIIDVIKQILTVSDKIQLRMHRHSCG